MQIVIGGVDGVGGARFACSRKLGIIEIHADHRGAAKGRTGYGAEADAPATEDGYGVVLCHPAPGRGMKADG